MRNRRVLRRIGAVVLALGLVAAACGDDDEGGEETEATTTTAAEEGGEETEATTTTAAPDEGGEEAAPACDATVPGSVLNYGVFTPNNSMDPNQSSAGLVGGTELAAVYDVLVRWDKETQTWEPHLAESLESNADFTEWTLTLREGITYGNGEPMVAQDVIDNINHLLTPGRNTAKGYLGRIDLAATQVVDERTIVFALTAPWAQFGMAMADTPGMVVNPRVRAQMGPDGTTPLLQVNPVESGAGVGAYEVASWTPGEPQFLTLTAKDDYWGGPVCVETINFINIPVDSTKIDALETGELDVAFFRTQDVIVEAREAGYGEITELQAAGAMVLINQGAGTPNPITADVRFRQAVSLALDGEAISQRAYGGELLVQEGMLHPDSSYWTEDAVVIEPDPAAAAELVEELKAEGWDGSIRLNCPDTNPDAPVAVEAALEAAGMDVDLRIADTNTNIAAVVVQKDFDLGCWGITIGDSQALNTLDKNFRSTSATNRVGYRNPVMDALLDELYGAASVEEMQPIMAEISALWAEDVPSAIYGAVEEGVFFGEEVTGIIGTSQSVFLLHAANIAG